MLDIGKKHENLADHPSWLRDMTREDNDETVGVYESVSAGLTAFSGALGGERVLSISSVFFISGRSSPLA